MLNLMEETIVATCSSSIVPVLSTFGAYDPQAESTQISSLVTGTYKLLHTYETLTFTNDLIRSTNAREWSCCNTIKPIWQTFSAAFCICGFTDVMIVVLTTKFKLVSFCTLIITGINENLNGS
jgi:hypothetical protein